MPYRSGSCAYRFIVVHINQLTALLSAIIRVSGKTVNMFIGAS